MQTLGDLVRQARLERRWTQEALAEQAGTSPQWVSQIERGQHQPSLELLVKLHTLLVGKNGQGRGLPLSGWLLQSLADQARASEGLDSQEKMAVQTTVDDAMPRLGRAVVAPALGASRLLGEFPRSFLPLTIVCGDRREPRPRTPADIFAYSVSVTDLMFLPKLELDESVTIRTDKIFMLMDEAYLRQQFGQTNLLVIGSPAVNLFARQLNEQSIFRFALEPEAKGWEKDFRSLRMLNDPRIVEVFWQMAQNAQAIDLDAFQNSDLPKNVRPEDLADHVRRLLKQDTPRIVMNRFRPPGLVDPADERVHARSVRQDNDFAMISLAPNPFADSSDFVSILVAGLHGPGTAHAVRALAEADFTGYPFGGILEVQLNLFLDWSTRFESARWTWQTKPYGVKDLEANFQQALAQPLDQRREAFKQLTDHEITNSLAFVRTVAAGRTDAGAGPRPARIS